jgi:nicotinamide mononucleotide transporter
MIGAVELAANVVNAASILLAGRNSIHTWWLGILGCLLFGHLFLGVKLYADVTLQLFFLVTSVLGWWRWRRAGGSTRAELPIRTTGAGGLALLGAAGLGVALGYGWLLHRFTDAYAPVLDAVVLAFSVLGQFLLVARRVESWWCWLIVNTIAVPLYAARGLDLTAALYAVFWVNAVISLRRWRRLVVAP